jgi:hypothetical protein
MPDDRDQQTRDLVLYFIQKLDGNLGRTKLIKLCYLTDLFHRKTSGRPVTGFQYKLFENGPFDTNFYPTVRALEQSGYIAETFVQEFNGHRYSIKKAKSPKEFLLTRDQLYVAERVAEKFGRLPLDVLLDEIVYRTEPAMKAKETGSIREPLDMDQCNNQLKNDLGLDFDTYLAAKEEQARGERIPLEDVINSL